MMQPIEAADDEMAAQNPLSPGNGGTDDARLGGLLNSLSSQVSDAFSQLSKIHAEVCAEREAVECSERERARELTSQRDALESQRDALERESLKMDQLRASVAASSAELEQLFDHAERMERDVSERRETLSRDAERVAELAADLDQRAQLLAARERAIDRFFAMLGRMQSAVVEASVAAIEEAAAAFENPEPMPAVEEMPGESAVSMPDRTAGVEGADAENGADATHETSHEQGDDSEPTPVVDLSDFSDEERATFGVRRRLRAYSDAFLAAEIRAERNGSKNGKKKRWF